jgi:high-affinity nickel permease
LFGISLTAERSVLGTLQDISIIAKAAEWIAIADARGTLGYLVVAMFVATWLVSFVIYRTMGYSRDLDNS